MYFSTMKLVAAANDKIDFVDRIKNAADNIRNTFAAEGFPQIPKYIDDSLEERIAEIQLNHKYVSFNAASETATPFTPMAEDADVFEILKSVAMKLDQLKDYSNLGIYDSSEVSRNFESTNADNFLMTFTGIAKEIADIGASGGASTVDVSSIVNSITDALSTAVNHSEDDLNKSQESSLIAARKGPNGTEYLGIKYSYEYNLKEWKTCGIEHKKGSYKVKKIYFVSYNLNAFASLYAKAFPDQKKYRFTFNYGDQVLEGSGIVLEQDQVPGKIIKALCGTVVGNVTESSIPATTSFASKEALVSIAKEGIVALVAKEFGPMTIKKQTDEGVKYYRIVVQVEVVNNP